MGVYTVYPDRINGRDRWRAAVRMSDGTWEEVGAYRDEMTAYVKAIHALHAMEAVEDMLEDMAHGWCEVDEGQR